MATIRDLHSVEGKAEFIGGKIVRLKSAGYLPALVAGEILFSLHLHKKSAKVGVSHGSTLAFVVPVLPSGRESFSPDASYYTGQRPTNRMDFIYGPPTFAVEVRNEEDYEPGADEAMAAKRVDYFAAGTLIVWDVDVIAKTIAAYHATTTTPTIFRRGDVADAEPAVPGWRIPVDDIFPE